MSREVDFAKALADNTRQEIMRLCCCQWLSVGDIADKVGLTQPTVSHHLAILRETRLVQVREEGRQTFYTLDQAQVVNCCGRLMMAFAPGEAATNEVKNVLDG
jgi:ArsR family transcriptional regulator, arsenate/arsenite/antimonite-responsive transcriptional repressor